MIKKIINKIGKQTLRHRIEKLRPVVEDLYWKFKRAETQLQDLQDEFNELMDFQTEENDSNIKDLDELTQS